MKDGKQLLSWDAAAVIFYRYRKLIVRFELKDLNMTIIRDGIKRIYNQI